MKPLILLFAVLFLASSCVHDKWTTQDKVLEGVYLTAHTVDWLQTRSAEWTDDLYEINPILRKAPSKTKTDIYFATTGLLHVGITHVLPQAYRKYWQILTFCIEAGTVINNYSLGMRINFQ